MITVKGLNIGNVVVLESCTARLSSVHPADGGQAHITPQGSAFRNLVIAGKTIRLKSRVDIYHKYDTLGALQDYYKSDSEFHDRFLEEAFVGNEDALHEKQQKFFPWRKVSNTAELPINEKTGKTIVPLFIVLNRSAPGFHVNGNVITVENFGTIVLGELVISAYERRLTMLHVDLGSPTKGQITVCFGGSGGILLSETTTITDERPRLIPSSVRMDSVDFTITAPATAAPGSTVELRFWVHDPSESEEVIKQAREIIGVDLMHRSEGPFELERGAKLSVRMTISGIDITPKHKVVQWLGGIGRASFVATVPKYAEVGPHVGVESIRLNGAQIARLDSLFTVGERTAQPGRVPGQISLHKNAFASYDSEDRDQVIARVQGMMSALKTLKVFVDVVNLRAGEYWEAELRKRILNTDVFYLFWCRHAKESKWVDMEWRFALRERGLDYIDPVPLEPAKFAKPPDELVSKHFNDPLLPYMAAHAKQIPPTWETT